jgi:ribosomal protein S18 acetylase RimI-like enzyme
VKIETFDGCRNALLPIFRLADESNAQIESYFQMGTVLAANTDEGIVGHVQLVEDNDHVEIISFAVISKCQRKGIGTLLLEEAQRFCKNKKARRLVVCTGVWESENIIFYLKRGFVIFNIERNFFTKEKGYDVFRRDQIQLEITLANGSSQANC